MTQKIFDTDNEEDMALLWSILTDTIKIIKRPYKSCMVHPFSASVDTLYLGDDVIKINWHDKTEITRPIQEATEADIGKICAFWEDCYSRPVYSELHSIKPKTTYKYIAVMDSNGYEHCRRLTKQEIEELC